MNRRDSNEVIVDEKNYRGSYIKKYVIYRKILLKKMKFSSLKELEENLEKKNIWTRYGYS